MTGKDLFDAINNIDEKYLDEVIAEIDKGSEQTHESGSYAKNGKSLIGRVLPWMAAGAMIAVLFTVAVAMHQRNRKPDNSEQKPANEATPTMTPTATVTETQIPDEEIEGNPVLTELMNCSPYELFNKSLLVATPEQKAKLEVVGESYSGAMGSWWKEAYTREIMTIMGIMPEDAPYLTLEDTKRLLEEMKTDGLLTDLGDFVGAGIYNVRERFNTIVTAPDVNGGSGFAIICYALGPDHKACIMLHSGGGIIYHDGENEVLLWPETLPGAPLEQLRVSHPECFELDASNGLTVMVASFAKENYRCTLCAGYIDETSLTPMEINQIYNEGIYNEGIAFNIETMKAILQTYHLPEEKIHIVPVQSVYSSYLYNIDDEYRAKLQEMFFGETGID